VWLGQFVIYSSDNKLALYKQSNCNRNAARKERSNKEGKLKYIKME